MAGTPVLFPSEGQLRAALDGIFERLENPKKGKVLIVDGPDPLPAGHVCTAAAHTLRETPLKLLPGGRIAKGMRTTLVTLLPAAPAYSLILLARDPAGTATLVSLRNWQPTAGNLSVAEAGALLPAGTELCVLEPYVMRTAAGGALLRVDNPANIQIVSRPGLTLDAGGSPERAEALANATKVAGDAHAAADRPAAALEHFTAGLSLGELVSPALRAALHANRAAAALSLHSWAAALLDCDRAIALDASNGTAALLRCSALLGAGRSASAAAFAAEQLARPIDSAAAGAAGGDGVAAASGKTAPASAAGGASAASVDSAFSSSGGGVAAASGEAAFKGYAEGLLHRAREAEAMRAGHLDVMTLPFTLEGQSTQGVGTYVGPIAVRDTGTRKGWGAFLTRDVKKGEVLLMERPLYARYAAADDPIHKQVPGEAQPDGGMTAGLTYLVQTPGADADEQVAAKLATLHSVAGPRWALEPPSKTAIRGESEALLPVPVTVPPPGTLTAKHIRGIVEANSFGCQVQLQEPTPAQRQPFAWAFDAAAKARAAAVRAFRDSQHKQVKLVPETPLQRAALADVLAASKSKGAVAVGKDGSVRLGVGKDTAAAVAAAAAARRAAAAASATATAPTTGTSSGDSAAAAGAGVASKVAVADSDSACKPGGSASGTQLQQLLGSMTPVERAAQLDAQDAAGMTALHYAVEYGCLEDVQALLAAGADPNLFDRRSWTPLHVAAALRCDDAVLRAVLDAGANVNAVAPGSDTPLREAVLSPVERSARMVVTLLHRGADPLILAADGTSLLQLLHGEDSEDDREALAAFSHAWPAKVALLEASGCSRARYEASYLEGSALYWVASFINHADPRGSGVNTQRVNIGGLMIILAERDMRAGTELTTVYAVDEDSLRHRGIK